MPSRGGEAQSKIKRKRKRDKYPDLGRELKNMEHEGDSDTNCNWCTWNNPKRIGTGTGGLGNKRKNGDYSDNSIIRINQNTEKSPGDLRRFAVTQTSMRNHQLALV